MSDGNGARVTVSQGKFDSFVESQNKQHNEIKDDIVSIKNMMVEVKVNMEHWAKDLERVETDIERLKESEIRINQNFKVVNWLLTALVTMVAGSGGIVVLVNVI